MKKMAYAGVVFVPLIALVGILCLGFFHVIGVKAATPTCTPTGFMRDNINLTAALINPSGTVGSQINANGCNIGIYYGSGSSGTVNNADIYGANYYGVVNDGGNVTISHSRVHDIGEKPFNGTQHGVAIYFSYASGAKGTIANNLIWYYQKAGIVVNGKPDTARISGNTVIGLGPVNFIAQNGIQIGYGAKATVSSNIVTGNSYTGSGNASSGGILVVGGSCYSDVATVGTQITSNNVIGNDVGIWLSNIDIDRNNPNNCVPTAVVTKVLVNKNIASNDYVNNVSGNGSGAGYQAGISDQGNYDKLTSNSICGTGYTPVATPPPYLYAIDDTATNNVSESGNISCSTGDSLAPAKTHATSKHLGKYGNVNKASQVK
ncbi:MAG: right-handed parallel beta-helix repeat-containing protein [Chloroflexota bacterium]|nr:right-handed parallel beta-helix repeat-containing protein [Chloroflexota bacterium]